VRRVKVATTKVLKTEGIRVVALEAGCLYSLEKLIVDAFIPTLLLTGKAGVKGYVLFEPVSFEDVLLVP
jgi:hypothetical protein